MTDEQFAALLALSHEQGHVEYKSPASFKDQPLRAKVVRAALGMSNRRDGGVVIIGVEEGQGQFSPKGLSPEQLATWVHDHIADEFRRYALPSIRFDQEVRQFNGAPFVVLTVHEFEDVLVLCQKQYDHPGEKQPILRKGALYVRPRGKPETVEVCTVDDMRDIIDLATDKMLRRHVARNLAAGWTIPGMLVQRDADAFAQELGHSWGIHERQVVDKIATRGAWHVVIRPEQYQPQRIDSLAALHALVEGHRVSLRGWDFPHVEGILEPHFDVNWIGHAYEWRHHLEAWRLFQSGQFEDVDGYDEDWLDQRGSGLAAPLPQGWQPGRLIAVEDIIFRCSEIVEFAARLASDERYHVGTGMQIKVALRRVQRRQIYIADPRKFGFSQPFQADVEDIVYADDFTTEDVVGRPRDLAVETAHYLFERFKWDADRATLRATQQQLWRS